MAPHSSTLAWKIPWAEEHGRLQSMGSLRVGHDWATSLSLFCIGEGNGNPLQCSCLENPWDGGAWWAAVHGVAQSRTRLKRLSSSRTTRDSPGGSEGKASARNVGDLSLIPGLGRSPGEESGNPLQYSCLENPMDRGGAWWATVHRISKSWHNWATSLLLAFYATAADSPDTLCSRKLVQKVFRELDTFRNWSHDANPCFSSYLEKQ